MAEKGEQTRDRILSAAEPLIMKNGFAGTSLDDILKAGGLTKGAFFHHFKGKGDLARALVERHAAESIEVFERLAAKAEQESDDPLDQANLFLKGFEDYLSRLREHPPGCMFAVYTYESTQFDSSINAFVADVMRRWAAIFIRKFEDVLAKYEPAVPVTSRQLAEMILSIIEGGLVLARAHDDIRLTARQSEQFRRYLGLLFDKSRMRKPVGSSANQKARSRRAKAEV